MAKETAAVRSPEAPKANDGVLVNHVDHPKHPYDYRVQQLGRDGKGDEHPELLVKGCCDSSEAIRVYCLERKLLPSKHRFKATKV